MVALLSDIIRGLGTFCIVALPTLYCSLILIVQDAWPPCPRPHSKQQNEGWRKRRGRTPSLYEHGSRVAFTTFAQTLLARM